MLRIEELPIEDNGHPRPSGHAVDKSPKARHLPKARSASWGRPNMSMNLGHPKREISHSHTPNNLSDPPPTPKWSRRRLQTSAPRGQADHRTTRAADSDFAATASAGASPPEDHQSSEGMDHQFHVMRVEANLQKANKDAASVCGHL